MEKNEGVNEIELIDNHLQELVIFTDELRAAHKIITEANYLVMNHRTTDRNEALEINLMFYGVEKLLHYMIQSMNEHIEKIDDYRLEEFNRSNKGYT